MGLLTTLNLSLSKTPVPPIAADVSLLLSASSFVHPFSGRLDPRAKESFDILTTAFCNGAKLYIPVPKSTPDEIPIFLELWKQHSQITIPDLELTDEAFQEISDQASENFVQYMEGTPYDIARWVAFQFTDQVVDNHLRRSDAETILRAGSLAVKLFANKRLQNFSHALLSLQKKENFREPELYTTLIGGSPIPSLLHFCAAYTFSVGFRGYSYAMKLGQLNDKPIYRHHWIRSPVLRTDIFPGTFRSNEVEPTTYFPWGTILKEVFSQDRSLALRNRSRVMEMLDGIRAKSDQIRQAFSSRAHSDSQTSLVEKRVTDEEILIIDTLAEAGVPLRYAPRKSTERLVKWLREVVEKESPIWKIPIQAVTTNLQPKWIRKTEQNLRIKFRRDTFWDIFEDPSIRGSVQKVKKQLKQPKHREN